MSQIQDFYANQNIFLTGVTGFVGKIVVEKLLRTCPDLKKIYLLVRPKREKTAEQRINEIFSSSCFDKVKSLNPDFMKKIRVVSGDCSQPMLGLNSDDIEILKNDANVFFHVAANVRFDADLKTAVYTNLRSVRDLLDLIKEVKNLRAFVYVSTAFSHCGRKVIREEFYDVDIQPEKLLHMVDVLDDRTLDLITPHLLDRCPNTYVYSKALAEDVIRNYKHELPVAVVRPSIVMFCDSEPLLGWTDSFQGNAGMLTGAGLGLVRSLHMRKDYPALVVPADFVVNSILAAAWSVDKLNDQSKNIDIPIYNCTNHKDNSVTWGWMIDYFKSYAFTYPLSNAIWYHYVQISSFKKVHQIRTFFYHTLFSYLIDAILFLVGKRTLAVEKYKRINKLLDVTAFFTIKTWTFENDNINTLWTRLTEEDKKLFNFNMKTIDWNRYFERCIFGMRVHLMKDPLETVPKAKRKMYLLFVLHYAVVGLVMYLWYCFFLEIFRFFFREVF